MYKFKRELCKSSSLIFRKKVKFMNEKELFEIAAKARLSAYAPYSGFLVGAALLASDGRVFTGCNVENASYSLGCCAERTAIFKAVSEGEKEFTAIAIAGGKENTDTVCYPCGACRQVMTELCGGDFKIILADRILTLSELMPYAFTL